MTSARPRPSPLLVAAALSLLLGLQPLTTDLYLPALPQIRSVFDAPMASIQLTMSVLIMAFGLAQLVWGPVADRFGRRPVLLASLTLYAGASLGCAIAPTIGWLVVLRAAQGAMMAAAVVVGRAMVRDLYEPHEGAQVMSRGMTGLGLIALASPTLGGWLAGATGWASTLVVQALVGLLTLAFLAWKLPESLPRVQPDALNLAVLVRRSGQILAHRSFRAWVVLTTSTYAGLFVVLSTSAFVFIGTLGLTPWQFGLALGANSLAYLLGTLWCRRWIIAHGLVGAVRRGAWITGTGALGLVLVGWTEVTSVWPLLAAQWLYAFGHGIHQPCGQTGTVGPFPQMAGTASALAGFILATTAFLIGLVLGWAFDGSVRFMAWASASGGLATAAAGLTLVQRHGNPSA